MLRSFPLLALLTLCSVASGYDFQCEPGTEPAVCSIWNLQYNEETIKKHPERLPVVKYQPSVKKVRLLFEKYYYSRVRQLARYDMTLHNTVLHSPSLLQICNTRMRQFVLPPNLQVGELSDNSISMIEIDSNKTYDITYLDLAQNSFSNVANLSVLVQLRTLNLEGNGISTLDASVFSRMTNLTHLYLGDNNIEKLDLKPLPKVLISLWLLRNGLHEISLAGVSLPALRELDLEANGLQTLDLAALFAGLPAIKVLPIAYNPFPKDEAKRIIAELERHNVTYFLGREEDCDPDEYSVGNLCFSDGAMFTGRSLWKAFVLLVVAVAVLALFGFSVRWIWYQMRY